MLIDSVLKPQGLFCSEMSLFRKKQNKQKNEQTKTKPGQIKGESEWHLCSWAARLHRLVPCHTTPQALLFVDISSNLPSGDVEFPGLDSQANSKDTEGFFSPSSPCARKSVKEVFLIKSGLGLTARLKVKPLLPFPASSSL